MGRANLRPVHAARRRRNSWSAGLYTRRGSDSTSSTIDIGQGEVAVTVVVIGKPIEESARKLVELRLAISAWISSENKARNEKGPRRRGPFDLVGYDDALYAPAEAVSTRKPGPMVEDRLILRM